MPSPTLRRLLIELEASLQRLEVQYQLAASAYLRGPLLRRRRAAAALRRLLKTPRRPRAKAGSSTIPTLSQLIEDERSLLDAYRAALAEAQANPALHQMLSLQKSETEQALLAFSSRQRRA